MAKPFPADEPFLRGYYAPLLAECDAAHLPITGEMPRELNGSLYRNGPNPQFAPRGPYHWFAGDGMLHAFHVHYGRVSYRNRWVRTPKWLLENAEGEGLSGAFGNPRHSDPRITALGSSVANTHVVWHAGRLLALEEAHAPIQIDPHSLDTIGETRFDGKLQGPMTAHPKIDPRSGEMLFFGYAAKGRFSADIKLHRMDAQGVLQHSQDLMAPYPSMVHDFVVSRDWVVMPIFPLTGSMDRAMKGAPPYAWEPDKGSHIALVPRHQLKSGAAAEVRWFSGDPCYVFHPMNAFDTPDGKLVCDMVKYPVAPLFPLPDGRRVEGPPPTAKLVRWTFDPNGASDSYRETVLDDHPAEFPRLDERYTGLPYRHGWFQAGSPTDGNAPRDARDGLAHIDHRSGNTTLWRPEPGDHCGEPVFVPRSADADADEGDGFILSVVFRGQTQCSDLAVFNALDITAGPIALAHLSHRVPAGFHGSWRQAAVSI